MFYNAQVIPYFAIYTFLPLVLVKMGVDSLGLAPTMLALTLVLVAGLIVSVAWAPETKGVVLD